MKFIILYADEFDYDTWEQYCNICGVSINSSVIKISFSDENVKSDIK